MLYLSVDKLLKEQFFKQTLCLANLIQTLI